MHWSSFFLSLFLTSRCQSRDIFPVSFVFSNCFVLMFTYESTLRCTVYCVLCGFCIVSLTHTPENHCFFFFKGNSSTAGGRPEEGDVTSHRGETNFYPSCSASCKFINSYSIKLLQLKKCQMFTLTVNDLQTDLRSALLCSTTCCIIDYSFAATGSETLNKPLRTLSLPASPSLRLSFCLPLSLFSLWSWLH